MLDLPRRPLARLIYLVSLGLHGSGQTVGGLTAHRSASRDHVTRQLPPSFHVFQLVATWADSWARVAGLEPCVNRVTKSQPGWDIQVLHPRQYPLNVECPTCQEVTQDLSSSCKKENNDKRKKRAEQRFPRLGKGTVAVFLLPTDGLWQVDRYRAYHKFHGSHGKRLSERFG